MAEAILIAKGIKLRQCDKCLDSTRVSFQPFELQKLETDSGNTLVRKRVLESLRNALKASFPNLMSISLTAAGS